MDAGPWAMTLIALVAALSGCVRAESDESRVRPPYFAQQGWYASDAKELAKSIDRYLEEADPPGLPGRVVALIVPHAGHRYSGSVASYGYKAVDPEAFDRVLLLGVCHRVPVRGASVPDYDAYRTPLGDVRLDLEACRKLLRHRLFSTVPAAHRTEHSLEIQLPFLQRRLKEFKLIPVAVGDVGAEDIQAMSRALNGTLTDRTLIVVSTDFTHYGEGFGYVPFRQNVPENLAALNRRSFEAIVGNDLKAFEEYLAETRDTICGRQSIKLLLAMLPKEAKGKLLKYDTSGRMTGDWRQSVSYASIAFYRRSTDTTMSPSSRKLTEREQSDLLRLARATLVSWVRERKRPDLKGLGIDLTAALKAKRGAFVTLNKDGRLRGCIGYIGPRAPLYRTVIDNAVSASSEDPRFRPVCEEELPKIEIEISALTAPVEVSSAEEFLVGRHGIVIRKGMQGAVYLPQVAPSQGWDRATTLSHLCVKAGLPPDTWRKPGMRFFVFEAEVFHEPKRALAATAD